jgi:hypothetical protein
VTEVGDRCDSGCLLSTPTLIFFVEWRGFTVVSTDEVKVLLQSISICIVERRLVQQGEEVDEAHLMDSQFIP